MYSLSHSIPRRYLKTISQNGHVLHFEIPKITQSMESEEKLPDPVLIGVNRCSTFYGFCSKHDNDVFSPIEEDEFLVNDENIALSLFRSICKELYTKQEVMKLYELTKDITIEKLPKEPNRKAVLIQNIQNFLGAYQAIEELTTLYNWICNCIKDKNYTSLRYVVYRVDGCPPVFCNSLINPDIDPTGDIIQNYNDLNTIVESLAFNVHHDGKYGYFILAWKQNKIIDDFVAKFDRIYTSCIVSALIQLIFAFSENHAISPTWFSNLSMVKKQRIKKIYWEDLNHLYERSNIFSLFRSYSYCGLRCIEKKINET